ncbi:MAG TPA: hypothetical protein VGC15_02935, partial [Acetobacteraceae bacterium]
GEAGLEEINMLYPLARLMQALAIDHAYPQQVRAQGGQLGWRQGSKYSVRKRGAAGQGLLIP